jgi:hypothetical protein
LLQASVCEDSALNSNFPHKSWYPARFLSEYLRNELGVSEDLRYEVAYLIFQPFGRVEFAGHWFGGFDLIVQSTQDSSITGGNVSAQGWSLVIAAVGITGTLAGAVVNNFLGRSWQKKQWVLDNKKQEYRELLSSMAKTERLIRESRATGVAIEGVELRAAWESENETWRVIQDRIFIADSVKKMRVLSRWSESSAFTAERTGMVNFVKEVGELRDEIMAEARRDLGMKEID